MGHSAAPGSLSNQPSSAPLAILLLLTAVFTLVFTPLAAFSCREAWLDWHAIPVDGVIVQVRTVRVDRPAPRARGPWLVVWEVECDPGGPGRVAVTAPGSYRTEADAEDGGRPDPGKRVTVWHVPGYDGRVRLDPPDWSRGQFAAGWTSAMAVVGWLGVASFVQLGWRRLGQRKSRQVEATGRR
jgi:hypothetical protein